MPSTLVHVAFAALLAAALLAEEYDRRALSVVLAVTALPDLDSFAAVFFDGAHRALLHTFLVPALAAALLLADTRLRERSALAGRFGARGVRIAWMSVAAYAVAGIGLDFVTNGVAPLYPLVEQFYALDGRLELSTTEGLVQTFVELQPAEGGGPPSPERVGSTENVTYTTPVDPEPGGGVEDAAVERTVPIVWSGWELWLLVTGVVVSAVRLRGSERSGPLK